MSAWREPGTVHGREALSVDIPGVEYGEDLALSRITRELEAQWADMPVYARDAWVAVLDFIADLPWEDDAGNAIEMPFPATTLLLALEAIDGDRRCDILAKMIRDATLAPDAEVRIKHYWGW